MKTGEGSIYKGPPKGVKADCTVVISDDDLVDLVSGKLNGQTVRIDYEQMEMLSYYIPPTNEIGEGVYCQQTVSLMLFPKCMI